MSPFVALQQDPTPAARQAPTATEMYEAARLAQRAVHAQLDQLQGERHQLRSQLQSARNPADIKGLEAQLAAVDASIAEVRKQVATTDAMVVTRAGVPGVVVQEPEHNNDIPPGAMVISGLAIGMVLLMPMSIAMARRIWRRAGAEKPSLPPDLSDRMSNIERGIEAVAIEVERLGEGQRFVTQLLAESDKRRQMQALPVEASRESKA